MRVEEISCPYSVAAPKGSTHTGRENKKLESSLEKLSLETESFGSFRESQPLTLLKDMPGLAVFPRCVADHKTSFKYTVPYRPRSKHTRKLGFMTKYKSGENIIKDNVVVLKYTHVL